MTATIFAEFSSAQSPESSPANSEMIFDVKAHVSQQIDAALAKSTKENRRVIILRGSNDSPTCIAFKARESKSRKK